MRGGDGVPEDVVYPWSVLRWTESPRGARGWRECGPELRRLRWMRISIQLRDTEKFGDAILLAERPDAWILGCRIYRKP